MTIGIAIAIVWFACGLYAAGIAYAYFQDEFPTVADRDRGMDHLFSYALLLLGPVGALIALTSGHRRHGWRLW